MILRHVLCCFSFFYFGVHFFHRLERVCFVQLLRPDEKSTSTQRYIDSRTVQPKAKGSWMSVDVSETIKDWVSDPGEFELAFPKSFSSNVFCYFC